MGIEENKEIVRRFVDKFNESYQTGDASILDEVTTEELVVHGVAGESNRDALKRGVLARRESRSNFQVTIDDIIAEDKKVSIRATRRLTEHTDRGDKKLDVRRYAIFYISNGKITDIWTMDDMLGHYQQLGLLPQTEEIGK